MNKKLDEAGMRSELEGSAFFKSRSSDPAQPSGSRQRADSAEPDEGGIRPAEGTNLSGLGTAGARATTGPWSHAGDEVVDTIRRTVKQVGKEEASCRLTQAEKKALAELVYTYGASGVRTSQNEITRIGINYLIEDYRANGDESVLARVLARLNE